MRVAIVGFMHESNTFVPTLTARERFEENAFHFGAGLLPVWRDAHHELGGFIQGCDDHGLEAVPILAAWATPGGPLSGETYEGILADILGGLDRAGSVDGLLLALHGAMVAEGFDSADSETIRRLRANLGPDFPIVMSLDMHANVSEPMVEFPTATVVYRTYPHVDQRERGLECVRLMRRILLEGACPKQAYVKLPLLIHIVRQYTGEGPMRRILDRVQETATSPGILSASFAPGFAYADVPNLGASVIVVADGDGALAQEKARALADFAFSLREELNARLPDPETAVRVALATPGTVSLMDCGDNVGGGGPGDSTHLFDEVLAQGGERCCVVLCDPEAAKACFEAGEGARVSLEVGAKTDPPHGKPIPISGTVIRLSEGRYEELEPRHGGTRFFDQGPTAVVRTEKNNLVALNSLRVMPTSLQQILSLGIRPEDQKILIVKGVTAPRAAYEPVSSKVICVDTPGVTQAGPESFPYTNRPVPLFPLEREVEGPVSPTGRSKDS